MIIDAHLHVWSLDAKSYPWAPIGGYIPEQNASIEEFNQQMQAAGVEKAVLVQPTPYGWDNAYLMDAVGEEPGLFKSVVLVDPTAEDNVEKLAALHSAGAAGLRVNLHIQPPEMIHSGNFLQLIEKTVELKMPVCFQLTPNYFSELDFLFKKFPDQVFVFDHMARPEKGSDVDTKLFKQLLAFSAFPNAYVKLSGLNYYSASSAPYKDTWPLLRAAKDAFTAQRCIWGSDFPFVNDHWSYSDQINTFKNDIGFTETELSWIMGKTADSIWWGS